MNYQEEIAALQPELVTLRRYLHERPEISAKEVDTSAFIKKELTALGLPYESLVTTGVIAILDTGREGKHLALRTDIDALPMTENPENLAGKRLSCSQRPGAMHACGHDAHMTILLGAIRYFVRHKDELTGILYFCFEEGEETSSGIDAMMTALSKYTIDYVWGLHVMSSVETGKISVQAGPRLAGLALVDFTIHGKGGHGSRPDLSVNPVFTAAMILNNLAAAFANQIDANETVTLGITSIQGGSASNVIPDLAEVKGTYRFFNVEEGRKALEISRSVFEHTAAMTKTTIEYSPNFGLRLLPVINNPQVAARMEAALAKVFPTGDVISCPPWYASESFHRYLDAYPGVFAFLGIKNPEVGSGAEHHNVFFDIDEAVLYKGVLATVEFVREMGK